MDIINFLLKNIEGVVMGIFIVLTSITSLQAKLQGKKSEKNIIQKLEENDKKHDNKIKNIEVSLLEINKLLKNQPLSNDLKKKVSNLINEIIRSYGIRDKELISYFDAGNDAVCYLIDYIMTYDFLDFNANFDIENFKRKIIYKLKQIKKSVDTEKLRIDEAYSNELKGLINNNISEFIITLSLIKSGHFNGTSAIKLENAFMDVTRNIMKDSIELYNNYKDSQ